MITSDLTDVKEQPPAREHAEYRQDIQSWLVNRLATMLQLNPEQIDVSVNLAGYGLGSVQGVELAGELSEWLERDMPQTLVWDYPTIEKIAAYADELMCTPG